MSKSVDDVINDALMHYYNPDGPRAYDPVKAHAYYIRTRQLKGRHPKAAAPSIIKAKQPTVKTKPAPHPNIPPELQARIKQLEDRLNQLRDHLNKLLASKHKKATAPKTHETLAEKQKRAASAKKYQQQHKSQIAQKRKQASASGGTPISSMTEAQLRSAIKTTLANLHAAVAKARAAANRGTA